jgi:hypothetical protein
MRDHALAVASRDIELLPDHVLTVYDQDVLLDASKDLKLPCLGVIYEGMVNRNEPRGLVVDLTCSFIIIIGDKEREILGNEDKSAITLLLDRIRNEILDTTSPTGHKWAFDSEFPMDVVQGALSYYQRWKTKAVLT